MTTLTQKPGAGGYEISKANGEFSRDQVTLTGGPYDAGTVLGKTLGNVTVGAMTAASGNTGNGVPGTFTSDASAPAGDYKLVCIKAATNAGKFEVFKPDGTLDGVLTVAAAYNGTINGTLADGATDFVEGDSFTVNVSYAGGKYTEHNPAGTDGSQNASAILYAAADGSAADVAVTVTARNAEVNKGELVWKSGITDDQKAAAVAQLAAFGILCR
jgi:hypothetical protein